MEKDYTSFSTVARPRFRGMATRLGFLEVSTLSWAKPHNDIFYAYSLQKSSGNDLFYINFGISIPYLYSTDKRLDHKLVSGYQFFSRMYQPAPKGQGFDCRTKAQIEDSAAVAESLFMLQTTPWFNQFQNLEDCATKFFSANVVTDGNIGSESQTNDIYALKCAFFHYHLGNLGKAKMWFQEVLRITSLPTYFVKVGNETRTVRERPKGAKIYQPDEITLRNLKLAEDMLTLLD